jgi:hypothetical protein
VMPKQYRLMHFLFLYFDWCWCTVCIIIKNVEFHNGSYAYGRTRYRGSARLHTSPLFSILFGVPVWWWKLVARQSQNSAIRTARVLHSRSNISYFLFLNNYDSSSAVTSFLSSLIGDPIPTG